jgi:malonate decarboxylase epsilon subunit
VEIPSGTVLTNLTAPVFTEGHAICCDNNALDTVFALIKRAARA